MPNEPQIESFPRHHRAVFFWALVVVFLVALPSLIFYTTGYRLSFENEETTVVTTGGMYVTTDNLQVDVYLDGEQVEKPRLFRSAYYIQHIETGQHRIVVQRPDLHTWVKELPVDSHIVIEASAFNMPAVPHVRPIAKYVTATGTQVYLNVSDVNKIFDGVSSTEPYVTYSSLDVKKYQPNEEYLFIDSLFASTSSSSQSVFTDRAATELFRFSTTTELLDYEATTTESVIESGGARIIVREEELYAVWQDVIKTIPHYFCISGTVPTSTIAERYGEHVAAELDRLNLSTTTPIMVDDNRICRSEIKLDRKRQDVYFYDFFPNSSDLVLLHLEDGLYVTEIDDRSWQNAQRIYTGTDFKVVVENDSIFISSKGKYFEIITEIELN
ncbi:MAG: hypothetical protein LR008_02335 [Candidatus Pacebacteria bacterium]|nr:hypothetical protein [Candidatus Paceibacterota bacterium]